MRIREPARWRIARAAAALLIVMTVATAAGIGMWLSALALQYRDVKYALSFAIQFLMYAAPVVYPTSLIPDRLRYIYAVNPLVGVIEGFRASLLGSMPIPWSKISKPSRGS